MKKQTTSILQALAAIGIAFSFFLTFKQVQAVRLAQVSNLPVNGYCTADVKQCPDGGGYVSRNPANNCQFNPCPGEPGYISPSPPFVCGNALVACPDGSFYNPCFQSTCSPFASPSPSPPGTQAPTIAPSPSVTPTPSPVTSPTPTPSPTENSNCTGPDINGDNNINIVDYSILAGNFLETKTANQVLRGDIDCNGVVNLGDYSILSQAFGTTVNSTYSARGSLYSRR